MSDFQDNVEAAGNLFVYGLGGIVQLFKMAKFKRCKIYIQNNHYHTISVALDDGKKKKIKGWFNINPFTKSYIYETERGTSSVGIHVECSACNKCWGNDIFLRWIPQGGQSFTIKYDEDDEDRLFYRDGYRKVNFVYQSLSSEDEEFTFSLN